MRGVVNLAIPRCLDSEAQKRCDPPQACNCRLMSNLGGVEVNAAEIQA
jgi:hypothetical protein